ncbi:MAG: hypothetical protein IJZ35_02605 [Clostridia bacterium]|nr:hypothetical protein [Clostridia bacterium]
MKNSNLKKVLCAVVAGVLLVSCALVNVNAKTLLRGDVDMNGEVTAADARLALRHSAQLSLLEGDSLIAADVDENGEVLANDARLILRVSAQLDAFDDPNIVVEESTDAEETTTEEPSSDETTTEEPSTDETTTEEPSTDETTTEEPSTDETTTEEPTVAEPAVDDKGRTIVTEYPAVIDSLFNKKFYLSCDSELNGQTTPMVLAMDGGKVEVLTSMDGQKTSMLIEKKKNWLGIETTTIYMKMVYNGTPSYLKLDEATLKLMGVEFDIDALTESFDFGSASDYKYVVCYTEEVDGAEYTVYAFVAENGYELCFCFDAEGNVKYMMTKSATGEISSKYNINELTGTIPSDVLTLKGYKELNIFEMMGDMM